MCKVGRFCLPQMQKCCFFLPLKKGLIAWGYCKLVFHVILMFYALMLVIRFKQLSISGYPVVVILFVFIIIDIIMNIIFLKSAQRDNYKLMAHYYYYTVVLLILYTIAFFIFTIMKMIVDGDFFFNWPYMLQDCVIGVGNFGLQCYFCELIKSHISNLRDGYDPEEQILYEEDDTQEERKKKRHHKESDDDNLSDDHSNSTSEDEVENKINEPVQSKEGTTSNKDNQETELTEIH